MRQSLQLPHQVQSTKEIRRVLSEAGVKASASRMAIASYVWNTGSHPTAEEIKIEVEKSFPTVSLATVYNTLNLFVEKGLIREVNDADNRSIRYDCNTRPHFHFVDEETGEMFDLDPRVLKVTPDFEKLGGEYKVSEIEVTIRGRRARLDSPSSTETKIKTKSEFKNQGD